jgi:DNA mismatch repair protein MutS
MKAVGLSVVLAQSGFFVPAKTFQYTPYTSIYTRITGNDNLFKGLSSYTLEMVELNAILKRSGKKTLVLGDEVCRGTEHISGNAIVAATLIHLADTESSFIFATHLHEIPELEEIRSRDNIKAFHLTVDYDAESDELVYDRKLKPGSGERIYGITVAKSIILDTDFIDCALKIKNEILEKDEGMIPYKKSSHNAKKLVHNCELCGKKKELETHHINFQKDFNKDGYHKDKLHIKKNDLCNITVLCETCHDELHAGKMDIEATKMTNKGKKVVVKRKKIKKK